MQQSLSFAHRYEPSARARAPTLLLLHGTGGNESDLLPLGRMIAPGATLLSPRGKVLENGMPRFFRRLAEGVFDEVDVVRRANELADFIAEARGRYGLPAPIAVGYSNGANVAAAVLLLRPEAMAGAILLRPMMPLRAAPAASLQGKPVLLLSGVMDPIATIASTAGLAAALDGAGASVQHRELPAGHELSQADIAAARRWLASATSQEAEAAVA
ncbi:MAG TPA: alpha/beta hydrolase [Hyphomicrobiaceae bacterium]|nr:alpha/beta hydrolase [Hyphomicrobiaceae bacterium]